MKTSYITDTNETEPASIENRTERKLPPELMVAMAKRNRSSGQNRHGRPWEESSGEAAEYTAMRHVYYAIWLDSDCIAGVAGDGDNGSYEWFIYKGKLKTSDCGFGGTAVALKELLMLFWE